MFLWPVHFFHFCIILLKKIKTHGGHKEADNRDSYGLGYVPTGLVLGPEWWRQEEGIRGVDAVGRSMV